MNYHGLTHLDYTYVGYAGQTAKITQVTKPSLTILAGDSSTANSAYVSMPFT